MSQVDLLYHLQQIDTEIRQKKQRLGEVLQAQKENTALLTALRQAAATAADLENWQSQQRKLNLELDDLNAKAKRSEDRLYSGNVKNPKELADLQKEIESLGRRRSDLEDEVLETMIMIEESQAAHDAGAAELAQIEAAWQQSLNDLQTEQMALATRLNELVTRRQAQVERVAPQSMVMYESSAKRRAGLAVAELKNNICMGCQVSLPASVVRAAQEGQLIHCSNCGRILHPR